MYRGGTLVLRSDLENHVRMKGRASKRLLRLISEKMATNVLLSSGASSRAFCCPLGVTS